MATTQIRGNTQIIGLTIVDAQVATAANIALTKLAKVPITPDGATPFTAAQSMGSQKITSLADPTVATDAATKQYVDNVAQGLSTKQSVRVLAASNITLSGTQAIDGVALSIGDTVLCIAQTTGSQNGSYTVAGSAWTRTPDFDDVNDQTRSPYWFVGEGTAHAASGWVMTTWPYTIGTTALSFTQFTGAGGSGTVTTVSVVTANGFAGTVANPTNTPAITLSTGITGMLKGNGTAISAAVAGTDYMAPADFVTRETPTGTVNGVNATFTLANTPIANTEAVFLNGLLQEPGAGNDYTISGATITMLNVPATGDRLRVNYQK